MRWGVHTERLERDRKAGKDTALIREVLDGAPKLYSDLFSVWEAFQKLSATRSYISTGFSAIPARIPYESIDRYAKRHGPNETDEYLRFEALIQAMDREFVQHHNNEASKKSGVDRSNNK